MGEGLKNRRNIIKVLLDVLSIFLAMLLASGVRFNGEWLKLYGMGYFFFYTLVYLSGYLYKRTGMKSWSYTNSLDVLNLVAVNLVALFGAISIFSLMTMELSRSVMLMMFVFSTILQLGNRFMFRLNRVTRVSKGKRVKQTPALIYGAGEAGISLVKEARLNRKFPYRLVGMIDDDSRKINTVINGVQVLGNFNELPNILDNYEIGTLILAVPTIEKKKIQEIVHRVREIEVEIGLEKNIEIKIVPSIDDLLHGEAELTQIRDVSIEDLLGREPILVNGKSIRGLIEDKVVFVTGGAGSIGSELARQIAKHNPKKLIAIDVNENALYFLELEMRRLHRDLDFQCEVCNIREKGKVEFLFKKYRPELVFHAAAHKHVPLMEHNPEEAVKNNVFGTKNVADMAEKYGAERFVLISTDKAVNPTNIMGATKRGCELVVEEANKKSRRENRENGTKFMAVRFGNVLGSNGSVIPIFKELIAQGKNLTITHRDITRYFMTIPEAAQLVIEAGSQGEGGEVFILDMGEPVRIVELAERMIELSGADVEIEVVGLRPGEKLYEELLYDVDSAEKTSNKKIFITRLKEEEIDIEPYLVELERAVENPSVDELKEIMKRFIVSYREPEHHKK